MGDEGTQNEGTEDKSGSDSGESLSGVIDRLLDETSDHEKVSLDDVFSAFSGRLYGPLLLIPSLALLTPLGGVPLMPIAIAVLLVLVAGQRVIGLDEPWIPKRMRQKKIKREKLESAFSKIRPAARAVDAVIRPRLRFLVDGPMERGVAVMILAVGLSVPVFGLVPLAALIPGAAAVLLSLALTARDGLLVILSWVVVVGGAVGWYYWRGGG